MNEKAIGITTLLIIGLAAILLISPVKANGTVLHVINPETGDSHFIFAASTPINTTFVANITITDVTGMAGWQLNLTWDPALLKIVTHPDDTYDIYRPTGSIFGTTAVEGIVYIDAGKVFWVVTRGAGKPTFTGNGTLCQIKFTILKNDTGGPFSCDLAFALNPPFPTKITNISGYPITFTVEEGNYVIPELPTTTIMAVFALMTMLAILFRRKNLVKHR